MGLNAYQPLFPRKVLGTARWVGCKSWAGARLAPHGHVVPQRSGVPSSREPAEPRADHIHAFVPGRTTTGPTVQVTRRRVG